MPAAYDAGPSLAVVDGFQAPIAGRVARVARAVAHRRRCEGEVSTAAEDLTTAESEFEVAGMEHKAAVAARDPAALEEHASALDEAIAEADDTATAARGTEERLHDTWEQAQNALTAHDQAVTTAKLTRDATARTCKEHAALVRARAEISCPQWQRLWGATAEEAAELLEAAAPGTPVPRAGQGLVRIAPEQRGHDGIRYHLLCHGRSRMTFMGHLDELSPYEARDAAGFIALMRQLKDRSGLTYRELEERAARSGDVLARSTLADILRRTSLPRPDALAAFVRACGDGRRVGAWLDARDRIGAAMAAVPPAAHGPGAGARPTIAGSTGSRPRRARGPAVMLTTSVMVPLLALAARGLLTDSSGTPDAPAAAVTASPALSDGWVTIRTARTPDLCLTDGRDRDGAYDSAVAVQLPCARATVPRTYLEPAGEGLYRIQWHHPQEGKGCLTVMSTGPVKGMLTPRNACARAILFRLEPAAGSSGGFRLHPAGGNRCVGIAGNDTTEGAEAIEERCTGAADQRFLIRTD